MDNIPDNHDLVKSFKRFLHGMHSYLTINLGWSDAEARDYMREPEQFKADWINGLTPSQSIDQDLSFGD